MARSPSRSSDGGNSQRPIRPEQRLIKAIEDSQIETALSIIEAAKVEYQTQPQSSQKTQRTKPTQPTQPTQSAQPAQVAQSSLSTTQPTQPADHLFRIALLRAAERGNITATEQLLRAGAKPDGAPGNRVSPLLRAVEKNHVGVVKILLKFGGAVDVADKQGRTALMTAAWKNHWHILNELIKFGADVNRKDHTGRNVLHNLAADKHCNWGKDVVDLLLKTNVAVDGAGAQDDLKRTPLHWACVTGKKELAEWLLTRPKLPRANVNAVEIREKTSLHLAAAHGRDDIVELLLKYGADANARSDGSWTPLHNACENGSVKCVKMLMEAGAEINARLLNGMTALHVAAQAGHLEVVKILLERKDIKRAARDSFGITPFLRAAQSRRKDIVKVLAPFNHVETLSEDALGACNGFSATIVDFGNFHNENKVRRRTVYELLYGRDPINPRKPAVTIHPKDSKATTFRWIHLPANNMTWLEALLTKAFIEEGASDVEGFKALERSFNHQHRGHLVHSHFMRPLCQSTPRAPRHADESDFSGTETEQGPPQIMINGAVHTGLGITGHQETLPKGAVRAATKGSDKDDWPKGSGKENGKDHGKGKDKGKKQTGKQGKHNKGNDTPTKEPPRRQSSTPLHQSQHLRSPGSPGRKDPTQTVKGNIFTFMPYLHFETDRGRQEMQAAISRAQTLKSSPEPRQSIQRAKTYDEMLLRAHLSTSTVSLHVRRTLDQFFYHNIDTQSRDQDQVVYRYQCKAQQSASHSNSHPPKIDPKIFMVDQLWMWILGKDLIVTAFPQRWQQPKNDPLNVLSGIIEDINSKTREPVRSVYDLAMVITGRCSGVFDRHRLGDEEYQFLDMFESSIGDATDRETLLFREFNRASAMASQWLQNHRRPNRFSRQLEAESRTLEHNNRHHPEHFPLDERLESEVQEDRYPSSSTSTLHAPLFVDKLLDIGAETDLLAETKDIRDELSMISKVLEDQRSVLPDLESSILEIYKEEHKSQQEVKKKFKEHLKNIEMAGKDLDRMDKQAERIYKSITDLLDLKQKHANAFEARFARDQASSTARQSQTIMVFTIVTIVFLPLSFIAAIFTINVKEFPRDEKGDVSLPFEYVGKWMFGIGIAVSIPLIGISLSLDAIGYYLREIKRQWRQWSHNRNLWRQARGGAGIQSSEKLDDRWRDSIDTHRIEAALSAGRSTHNRRSVETDYLGGPLLPVTSGSTWGRVPKGEETVRENGVGIGRLSAEGRERRSMETRTMRRSMERNGGDRPPPPPARMSTGFKIRRSMDVERGV